MSNRAILLLTVILSFCFVFSLIAVEQDKRYDVEKTFKTSPGQKLTIELRTGGEIHIAGSSSNEVIVKARIRGEDRDDCVFEAEETKGGVQVSSHFVGNRKNYNVDTDVNVQVPSRFNIDLETMGGDLSISNVEGNISGQTMGGGLNLQSLKGNIQLTTMGGEIMLEDSNLDGSVKTMGGDVVIRNVSGSVKGSTMGGDVRYENAKAGNKSGEVKIHSMGGDLNVNEAPEGASVETMGGDIHVRSADKFVHAQTMGGDIHLDSVNGWVDATTMGGNVKVRITGNPSEGKRDIDLSSMGGDIELTVPDGMEMDLDLQIEFDADRSAPKIISDFPVKTWEEEGHQDRWGNSKILRGTGKTGAGRHKVRVKTIQGNIYIKRG